MSTQLINVIFGLKIRQARQQAGFKQAEFARRCDLSTSYLAEIEKGRKYPRTDKIFRMAEVLEKSYDELVSIQLSPSFRHLEQTLASPALRQFPFDEFGLEMGHLFDVLSREPEKASALIHALLDIARQYDMRGEHFLRAALRSYQELYENYFPEIEEAATQFAAENGRDSMPVSLPWLQQVIQEKFNIRLDDVRLAADPDLAAYRSVFVPGKSPQLLLNAGLHPNQIKFLIAREIGYQVLGIHYRAKTSAPDEVTSFQQVFNDFRASYFAGALLMPQKEVIADLESFFALRQWDPERLTQMLTTYDVTPEMLLYRMSELIPHHFDLRLHFLRMHDEPQQPPRLIKQLNMSGLKLPLGSALDEHFCHRWLVVQLLNELAGNKEQPLATGAQLSQMLEEENRYFCFGFARPLVLNSAINSSVIIGFPVNADTERVIQFLSDSAITQTTINQTCERCRLTPEQCSLRAAEPVIYQAKESRRNRKQALRQLQAELQG